MTNNRDEIKFSTSDNFLAITEQEAFALLSSNTPITICDVYSTREEMFGEERVQDVVPTYVYKFEDWKKALEESVYMEEVRTDVIVRTMYYVNTDDLNLQ